MTTKTYTDAGSATENFSVKSFAAVGRIAFALAKGDVPFAVHPHKEGPQVGYLGPPPLPEAFLLAFEEEERRTLALTLHLEPDQSPMCPAEADGVWVLYSLDRNHSGTLDNLEHRRGDSWLAAKLAKLRPEEPGAFLADGGKPQAWLRAKLKAGLAWPLHISADNTEPWRIGERGGCDPAGWLIWEEPTRNMGAKTVAARRKDADRVGPRQTGGHRARIVRRYADVDRRR